MKKFFISASLMMTIAAARAQVTLNMGDPRGFTIKKQANYTPLVTDNGYYFVFKNSENIANITWSLITADAKGNLQPIAELKIDQGTFNNSYSISGVYAVGNKLVAAIENPDKSAGLNRMSFRMIENGKVGTKDIPVGGLEFKKLMNAGTWFVSVTPDKNHIAVVGQLPRDKDEPNQYKYFFLDKDLNELSKGNFTFGDDSKKVHFNSFAASDKGDLYLIENEFDKTYTFPKLYTVPAGSNKGTIVDVQPSDPSLKIMSYTTAVNEAGNLLLAGYYKKKANVVVGDEQAKGSWWFNAADGKMVMKDFDKPVNNMKAEGLIRNGDTWFLVGEQLKAERETPTGTGTMNFEENYNYKHNDLLITAFDATGATKFAMPLSKSNAGRNFDADLYPAFGVMNGKLAVVYNDQYGKYFSNTPYSNYKLPVLVNITNDGLMEAPVHFAKELQVTNTPFTLYPQVFNSTANRMVILTGSGTAVKAVVLQ